MFKYFRSVPYKTGLHQKPYLKTLLDKFWEKHSKNDGNCYIIVSVIKYHHHINLFNIDNFMFSNIKFQHSKKIFFNMDQMSQRFTKFDSYTSIYFLIFSTFLGCYIFSKARFIFVIILIKMEKTWILDKIPPVKPTFLCKLQKKIIRNV